MNPETRNLKAQRNPHSELQNRISETSAGKLESQTENCFCFL
jgi:hypothetical protein